MYSAYHKHCFIETTKNFMIIIFTSSFLLFATVGETVVKAFASNVNVNINFCWWMAVKVVKCVLLVCANHLTKAILRTPNIITLLLILSASK